MSVAHQGCRVLRCNMTLSVDVSVRELRNHAKQVIERIEDGTTMYLTKNGERIATIAPLRAKTWAAHVDDVVVDDAYDGGLADLLVQDDAESAAFDEDHLSPGR
jgi:prevent-host-death family protein